MNESYIARTSGLKTKDYVGYAMIDAAGCLVFSLVTTLLQKFYTDMRRAFGTASTTRSWAASATP